MLERIEAVKDDEEAVKALGIELGTQMCAKLLAAGSPGLHLYTLNLEKTALAILEKLGLIKLQPVPPKAAVAAPAPAKAEAPKPAAVKGDKKGLVGVGIGAAVAVAGIVAMLLARR